MMKIDFMKIPVDALTINETVDVVDRTISSEQKINHVVINAGKVVLMQKDKKLYDSVISCDLINADGQSIVWASHLLGNKIPERVTGADLMPRLIELASQKKYKCFFFGATEEVLSKVIKIYRAKYGSNIIAGYRNGYFLPEEEVEIAKEIANSGAQLLFVAISSPKKENFLHQHRDLLGKVNFTMGVGGTFDIISGKTTRAPIWMQKAGMEWFYRFVQEPKRMWRRYTIGNARFIWLVLVHSLKRLNEFKRNMDNKD